MTEFADAEGYGGFIKIPISKCLLLATKDEFTRMLNRGKWYLRAKRTEKRTEERLEKIGER